MSHIIIEMSEAEQWPSAEWAPSKVIPAVRRPTMLQPDRETAEREALRLTEMHPGRRFVVFAPVSAGVTAKIPTHVTLGGKVFAERHQATLVEFGEEPDDDGIPF